MQRKRHSLRCRFEALEDRRVLTATLDAPLVTTVEAPLVSTPQDDIQLEQGNGDASALRTEPGDFDGDGFRTATDVDLLCANMGATDVMDFDLTGDGLVDQADMDMMIENLIGTHYGDANLDGVFTPEDSKAMFRNIFQSGTGWATGDFNCDQRTDGFDFVLWNTGRHQVDRVVATPDAPTTTNTDTLGQGSASAQPATAVDPTDPIQPGIERKLPVRRSAESNNQRVSVSPIDTGGDETGGEQSSSEQRRFVSHRPIAGSFR